MAVDTATKRASALSFGIIALALVVPSGSVAQEARQTSANTYSGILADAPIIITPDDGITLSSNINPNGVTVSGNISEGITLTSKVSGFITLSGTIKEGVTLSSNINNNGITVRGPI